ncbi:serine/threonine protein phosphatase [Tissierella sp. MSJ-40]|uniref:Serine/threonine protein phosphatase n=1 Tax=Tissierella simiarum TaxID=2841534 RepID=A0ABS6E2Q7_9FIRM|nr:metallophosphoesterase family protein [Tissierella simiarum]MBU5437074.1 serine/threonine protein phosphatase [Tissierella simiarum]
MNKYKNTVDRMDKVKFDLENNGYSNGKDLELDFFASNSLVWEGLNDLAHEDLNDLYKVHEFLISEVCKIHNNEEDHSNMQLFSNNLNIRDIKEHLEDGKRAFNTYSFNDYDWDYYVIGDIHSDSISTKKVLEKIEFFNKAAKKEKIRVIFVGDYVDRGKEHFKTLQLILSLKYIFPENIYLLRGNHDGGYMENGKVKLWVKKPESDSEDDWFLLYMYNLANKNATFKLDIINKYLKLFDSLANIAFICHENINIMVAHGGIPRPRKGESRYYGYINSISDLTNENIKDHLNKTIVNNMMWSDPAVSGDDLRENNTRFRFLEEHFEEFRDLIGFDIFIRGHQAEKKGYRKFFNDRFITVFSSGMLLEGNKNINKETAYKSVNPKILKVNKEGEILILDMND